MGQGAASCLLVAHVWLLEAPLLLWDEDTSGLCGLKPTIATHPVKDMCLGISESYGVISPGGHTGKCQVCSQEEAREQQPRQGCLWLEGSEAPTGTSCLLELGPPRTTPLGCA